MSALVLGAAGFLGVNLVDGLQAIGVNPVCGRRRRTNIIPLRSRGVSLVPADLDSPGELLAAMRGHHVVFHLAGHYPRTALHADADLETGLSRTQNVLHAAAQAGVRRLVFVSSTATVAIAPGRPSTEADTFDRPPGYGVYHDLKWHLEAMVLAERRLECVVVCPGACIGAWDLRVGTSAILVATALGLRPPHADGWVPLVDVQDVARALCRMAVMARPPPRVLLVGHNLRLAPLLAQLSRRYRVAAPVAPLEPEAARALADTAERLAEASGKRAQLSREIVDLVVHGAQIDSSLGRTVLGAPFAALETTLDRFDTFARRMRFIPPQPDEVHV